MITRRLCCAND